MIQATLEAGVDAAAIAAAMRERRDKLEWYTAFHARLLKEVHRVENSDPYGAAKRAIAAAPD
jgi:hypothetical protein